MLEIWSIYVHVLSECRKNNDMKRANEFSENMTKFKYFGMTPTDLNADRKKLRAS
jgi:hypothetical protein